MLAKHALLSYSNDDDSKMVLFVKIGPRVAEFLALQTDRDSRLLIYYKHKYNVLPTKG